MSATNDTTQIIGMLAILAEQCSERASDQRLAWMASKLAPHGLKPCAEAIESLMSSARRFPTVAEIEKEMGVGSASLDPEDIGREVADRIYAAIGRFGQTKNGRERVWEYIGPIGVELVRLLGGWEYVCANTLEKDASIHKAQWRESAAILAHKAKRGELNMVPGAALAAIPQKPGLNPIDIDSMTRMIGGPPYE